jgi:hypothetical protein
VPQDIGGIGASGGVTGDVRNVALAQVADRTYAFLTAGTTGIHVVDVTEPDLVNRTNYITTISPGLLAGSRSDAINVIDGLLVSLSVGSATANSVTIFLLESLIDEITMGGDPAMAVIPLAMGDAGIPVPGNADGAGGGVSGGGGQLFVATGAPTIAHAVIDTGGASWSTMTPLTTTAEVVSVVDVQVNGSFAIYASAEATSNRYGFVTLGHPLNPVPVTPTFEEFDNADFDLVLDEFVVGPGTYPLDMALDSLSLYVTAANRLQIYNVTNPIGPVRITTVDDTGIETITVDAVGQTVVLGAGDSVQILANALGQARITGQVTFGSTYTIRGVQLRTTDQGTFCICAAGNQGVRVVQLTETTP